MIKCFCNETISLKLGLLNLKTSYQNLVSNLLKNLERKTRDVEAEAGSRSGPFSVEAEARTFYRFGFHIGYLTS